MRGKRRSRPAAAALIGFSVFAAALAVLYILYGDEIKKRAGEWRPGKTPIERAVRRIVKSPDGKQQTAQPEREPRAKRQIAILIDDIGCDLAPVRELLDVAAPLAFAVLPYCPHALEASDMIHRTGREVLLHLPMEPHAYPEADPGPDALLLSMPNHELIGKIERNLRGVRHVRGVNNHMGSKFMEDEEKLSVVLGHLKKKGCYFIDSRTTGASKGPDVSESIGLRYLSRDIFIDNRRDHTHILDALNRISENRGRPDDGGPLLIIGHPYPATIGALKAAIPHLKARGIEIVPVSEAIAAAERGKAVASKGAGLH